MTARAEQETVVTIGRDETVVRIWTCHLPHLRRLRSNDLVKEVAGGSDWGQFEVPAEFFFLFSAIRRKRAMSEQTRAKLADRLAVAREARA